MYSRSRHVIRKVGLSGDKRYGLLLVPLDMVGKKVWVRVKKEDCVK